jgi:LAS superfamily LD-carboxypeptidase LdcB
VGLVVRQQATTGGTDIVAMMIQKYFHIGFSNAVLIADSVVVLSGLLVIGFGVGTGEPDPQGWLLSLYSLITIYVTSRVLEYTINGASSNKLIFIILNKHNEVLKDFILKDLDRSATYIQSRGMYTNEEKEMRAYASYALDAMVAEMKYLGVYDTFPQSPYRSYALQYKLYHRYLGEERALHPDYTEEQIIALVDSYSARPGTSDHQTGLAVDFYPISEKFEKRKAYTYLLENAHKFGFILRFPEGKTDITGYMFESWHWRFVGREAATYIHEHGITLEEYLGITG